VAIKHVSLCSLSFLSQIADMECTQIDLESSEDDIAEIQQEISVLAACASPYVTQYKASFLRGHKLWIVMEFLGGGSCLDLVGAQLHLFARKKRS
jgi:serine/threonine protein kinase